MAPASSRCIAKELPRTCSSILVTTTSSERYGHSSSECVTDARAAGVTEVYIDPGIGFGKSVRHNLQLLAALPELVATGVPVLVGTSRKSFIGHLGAGGSPDGRVGDIPPLGSDDRLEGSLASAVWAMACGAAVVRVHDVAATVQAARLFGEVAA